MNDFPRNGHYLLCPLCEGRGRMTRSEMAARLADPGLEAKVAACRQQLVEAATGRPRSASEPISDFRQQVLKGPLKRMLWRRSPKE